MPNSDTFDLFPVRYGSGTSDRVCLHVRVRMWHRPKGFEDKDGIVCITAEACVPDELDSHIDELIVELRKLKITGRRKMAKLEKPNT